MAKRPPVAHLFKDKDRSPSEDRRGRLAGGLQPTQATWQPGWVSPGQLPARALDKEFSSQGLSACWGADRGALSLTGSFMAARLGDNECRFGVGTSSSCDEEAVTGP